MLPPLGTLLPQALQARGRHILDTRQGFPWEPQLDLACRILRAALLSVCPEAAAPNGKDDGCAADGRP